MDGKIKAAFSKKGPMVFVSHLDLMRLFQRASRRAGLPVALTKGFNPHLKISIMNALKVGVESDALEAVICLERPVAPEEFMERLNAELPEGVTITHAAAG